MLILHLDFINFTWPVGTIVGVVVVGFLILLIAIVLAIVGIPLCVCCCLGIGIGASASRNHCSYDAI